VSADAAAEAPREHEVVLRNRQTGELRTFRGSDARQLTWDLLGQRSEDPGMWETHSDSRYPPPTPDELLDRARRVQKLWEDVDAGPPPEFPVPAPKKPPPPDREYPPPPPRIWTEGLKPSGEPAPTKPSGEPAPKKPPPSDREYPPPPRWSPREYKEGLPPEFQWRKSPPPMGIQSVEVEMPLRARVSGPEGRG
jgi:hypothetical protein